MIKVYGIHQAQSYGRHPYYWDKEIEEIKSIDPDKIIIFCLEEFDIKNIMHEFFIRIEPWLKEKRKFINILLPGYEDLQIPWALPEATCGYFPYMMNEIYSGIKNVDQYRTTLDTVYLHKKFNLDTIKLFTCYNNNAKYERALFVDMLAKHDLLKEGIVTLNYPSDATIPNSSDVYKYQYHDGSRLIDEPDYEKSIKPEYAPVNFPKSYFDGLIDISPESSVGKMFFMTEKTIKALIAQKPFLSLCSPGYHTKYLKGELGIELYDEVFDYSFDNDEILENRINGIIGNIITMKNLLSTRKSKENFIQLLTKKLYKNQFRLLELYFDKKFMIPSSLRFMENTDYQWFGFKDSPLLNHLQIMGWVK